MTTRTANTIGLLMAFLIATLAIMGINHANKMTHKPQPQAAMQTQPVHLYVRLEEHEKKVRHKIKTAKQQALAELYYLSENDIQKPIDIFNNK